MGIEEAESVSARLARLRNRPQCALCTTPATVKITHGGWRLVAHRSVWHESMACDAHHETVRRGLGGDRIISTDRLD